MAALPRLAWGEAVQGRQVVDVVVSKHHSLRHGADGLIHALVGFQQRAWRRHATAAWEAVIYVGTALLLGGVGVVVTQLLSVLRGT